MQITHLGHSCLLIEVAAQRLLIDPGSFSDVSTVQDLTAVLVTHQHPDHLDPDAVQALLADNPQAGLWLESGAADTLTSAQPRLGDRVRRMSQGSVVEIGDVRVTPVGQRHAFIHDYVPLIDNLGLVVRADGEPTLFHPGDALDAEHELLDHLDLLCVPVNAPWARVGDTVGFVRRLAPARVIPIHDGLLNDTGRGMYLGHIGGFGAEGGVEVLDLRGQGAVTA